MLANQIVLELVGSTDQQLNYYAGVGAVLLPVGDPDRRKTYIVTPPTGDPWTLLPTEKAELTVSGVERVGNYRVGIAGEPHDRYGFSVNLPARLTDLARLTEKEVKDLFGSYAPQIARSSEQIVRNQGEARVGREIYTWLIIVVAGLLAMEYIVSNWFYKPE